MTERRSRVEEITVERRARRASTNDRMQGLRLQLDAEVLDPGMHYLWANDEGDNLRRLYQDGDYDFVSKNDLKTVMADNEAEGDRMVKTVNRTGTKAYLMAKHKDWWQDDLRARLAPENAKLHRIVEKGSVAEIGKDADSSMYAVSSSKLGSVRQTGRV